MSCPNGWDDRPTCTHPMCPVHKTEEQRKQAAAEWDALIAQPK
jgi:hypothetical protein